MPMLLPDVVSDGIEQVGFTHTGGSADEERIVALGTGVFGDVEAGRVGELVVTTDHEGVEGVLRREDVAAAGRIHDRGGRAGLLEDRLLGHRFFQRPGAFGLHAGLLAGHDELDLEGLAEERGDLRAETVEQVFGDPVFMKLSRDA